MTGSGIFLRFAHPLKLYMKSLLITFAEIRQRTVKRNQNSVTGIAFIWQDIRIQQRGSRLRPRITDADHCPFIIIPHQPFRRIETAESVIKFAAAELKQSVFKLPHKFIAAAARTVHLALQQFRRSRIISRLPCGDRRRFLRVGINHRGTAAKQQSRHRQKQNRKTKSKLHTGPHSAGRLRSQAPTDAESSSAAFFII